MCTRKKNEWLNNVIKKIEESNKKNESKKFFNEIKHLIWQNTRLSYMCKNVQNTILTQMGQILNRWKEYFCTLLNTETEGLPDNHKTQLKHSDNQQDIEIPAPTFNEVCCIINKLKSGKAGGTDNIIPELIKYGGRALKHRIYRLITMIWKE